MAPHGGARRRALRGWGIDRFRVEKTLGGTLKTNWRVTVDGQTMVLRRAFDSGAGEEGYLDYQVEALRRLQNAHFSAAVPAIISTRDRRPWHDSGEGLWLLYPFIPGTHPDVARPGYPYELGRIVGEFTRVMRSAPVTTPPEFHLRLFEREQTVSDLTGVLASSSPFLDDPDRRRLSAAIERYVDIPDAVVSRVAGLRRQTVYNDWHRGNLLEIEGSIRGLIDFDSVLEAPEIVDFQNGLSNLLMALPDPHEEAIGRYRRGYQDGAESYDLPIELLWPVMRDRLLWLVGRRAGKSSKREANPVVRKALGLLEWLQSDPDPPLP
jgi:Ser/Thr protein kinase RdoA (MazF antagonist)